MNLANKEIEVSNGWQFMKREHIFVYGGIPD
jgi:hypothetical protein